MTLLILSGCNNTKETQTVVKKEEPIKIKVHTLTS